MRRYIEILTLTIALSLLSACGGNDTPGNSVSSQLPGTAASINLSWTAPGTRTDGSFLPMSDLAGFRVYMGTSSGELTPLVDLDSGDISEYTVNDLSAGSYYFAISAFDTDGRESGLSQVVRKQIG